MKSTKHTWSLLRIPGLYGACALCFAAACSSPAMPDGGSGQDGGMDGGGGSLDVRGDTETGTGDTVLGDVRRDGDGAVDVDVGTGCPGGCAAGLLCRYGVCVPNLGSCQDNASCPGDSYCDVDGQCVPYGVPAGRVLDENCRRSETVDMVLPTVQCAWNGPPSGDPTADFTEIYSTPVVAELNLDGTTRTLQPSIVAVTFDFGASGGRRGPLRIFDGRSCEEQMRIGLPGSSDADLSEPSYGSQIAIGDLNGDLVTQGEVVRGHPELVTLHRVPGTSAGAAQLIAYAIVDQPGMTPPWRLERHWIGRRCDLPGQPEFSFGSTNSNHGPTLVDLDDDGRPEVLLDRYVFDAQGCVLNPTAEFLAYIGHGIISVAADVDADNLPELVHHDGIYRWDATNKAWQAESYFQPTATARAAMLPGNTAVADFGTYATPPGTPSDRKVPEVVVVSAESATAGVNSTGSVRIQTLTGEIVFGPYPIPAPMGQPGGRGGPPTAADFDGDGQLEVAAAAGLFYTVYDPDCAPLPSGASRPGGRCVRAPGATLPAGVLWAQSSQDGSSNITGSSVFDFDGDRQAEVVYRDECYLRVYRGATGEVIFSSPASSGTGYEMPVIADVDGDFATEIVVPRTGGPTCPSPDPLAPPGMQQTWAAGTGFVVLRDPMDRWAASRPIWNQHAYSVTNITDDGRVPRARDTLRNWEQPGLNNFRQNVQGSLGSVALADLTIAIENAEMLCASSGSVTLQARVCNRGTNPVADGALVRFEVPGTGGGPATALCDARTSRLLLPGECTPLACDAVVNVNQVQLIQVVADPDGQLADCHPGNNRGLIPVGYCGG